MKEDINIKIDEINKKLETIFNLLYQQVETLAWIKGYLAGREMAIFNTESDKET